MFHCRRSPRPRKSVILKPALLRAEGPYVGLHHHCLRRDWYHEHATSCVFGHANCSTLHTIKSTLIPNSGKFLSSPQTRPPHRNSDPARNINSQKCPDRPTQIAILNIESKNNAARLGSRFHLST